MTEDEQLAALVAASRDVVATPPEGLLLHVEATPAPLNILTSFDRLHVAMQHADGGLGASDGVRRPTAASGLMRWLIDGFLAWTQKDDPGHVQLVALLIALQAFGRSRAVWASLPDEIGANDSLVAALEAAVLSSLVTLTPAPRAAIWETEALAAMTTAEQDQDWQAVADRWRSFETVVTAEPFLSVATKGLARFRFERLVPATRNHAATMDCMRFARTLSMEERLRLATMTANEHVRFGCAYSVSLDTPRQAALPKLAQDLLTDVFVRVSQDRTTWRKWLAVFAQHSVRHRPVQASLGKALALACEPAIAAYVGSINLQAGQLGSRDNVASCLRAFRDNADSARQIHMWKVAFDRWDDWNFGGDQADIMASGLSRSDLDFAVVGHAVCALTAEDRAERLTKLRCELASLDDA